jgi:hypothetical protein
MEIHSSPTALSATFCGFPVGDEPGEAEAKESLQLATATLGPSFMR